MGRILMKRLEQTVPFGQPSEEALVNLMLAASWVRDALEKALAPLGLTHAQYNVLRILRGARPLGRPRCEIARRLIDRAPDVTRLVGRLVRAGLAERSSAGRDRRLAVTCITPKGLKLLEWADREVDSVHALFRERLGDSRCEPLSAMCESLYGPEA